MTATSHWLGQSDLSASLPGRTVEKVSRQYSRWLEGLSPFFPRSGKGIETPRGVLSERLRVDSPGLSLRSLGTTRPTMSLLGCWPTSAPPRSPPPLFKWRNLPLSLISGPRGTSRVSLFFKNAPRFPARKQHEIPPTIWVIMLSSSALPENRGSTNGLP